LSTTNRGGRIENRVRMHWEEGAGEGSLVTSPSNDGHPSTQGRAGRPLKRGDGIVGWPAEGGNKGKKEGTGPRGRDPGTGRIVPNLALHRVWTLGGGKGGGGETKLNQEGGAFGLME